MFVSILVILVKRAAFDAFFAALDAAGNFDPAITNRDDLDPTNSPHSLCRDRLGCGPSRKSSSGCCLD